MMEITEEQANALVWSGKAYELAAAPRFDPTTWVGALQMSVIESPTISKFELNKWRQSEPVDFVCALLMIKNEEDVIGHNLNWLYYLGVRKYVVIDNNSDDASYWIIERFRRNNVDAEVLILSDHIERHIQGPKTSGIMQLAANVWPDCSWVLPIDADEFLIAEQGLQALGNVSNLVDAIVVPKSYHYVLASQDCESKFESDVFSRMPIRTEKHRAPPKIILRTRPYARIGPGNHYAFPIYDGHSIVYSSGESCGLYYREFSVRSYIQFKKKVIDGGRAVEKAESLGLDVGGSHWKLRYAGYLSGGDNWLRERYYTDFCRVESEALIYDPFPVSLVTRSLRVSALF